MGDLILFYKVYQDFESVSEYEKPAYYVETEEGVKNSVTAWVVSHIESDIAMPLLEPVLMTKKEFEELPEFQGF
jgi:hypothetical protein